MKNQDVVITHNRASCYLEGLALHAEVQVKFATETFTASASPRYWNALSDSTNALRLVGSHITAINKLGRLQVVPINVDPASQYDAVRNEKTELPLDAATALLQFSRNRALLSPYVFLYQKYLAAFNDRGIFCHTTEKQAPQKICLPIASLRAADSFFGDRPVQRAYITGEIMCIEAAGRICQLAIVDHPLPQSVIQILRAAHQDPRFNLMEIPSSAILRVAGKASVLNVISRSAKDASYALLSTESDRLKLPSVAQGRFAFSCDAGVLSMLAHSNPRQIIYVDKIPGTALMCAHVENEILICKYAPYMTTPQTMNLGGVGRGESATYPDTRTWQRSISPTTYMASLDLMLDATNLEKENNDDSSAQTCSNGSDYPQPAN